MRTLKRVTFANKDTHPEHIARIESDLREARKVKKDAHRKGDKVANASLSRQINALEYRAGLFGYNVDFDVSR